MIVEQYLGQMKLLISLLPVVLKDRRFALKGGTAINLFYTELPRISVDIDLVYLPLEDRDTTFDNIHLILKRVQADLEVAPAFQGVKINSTRPLNGKGEVKLIIKYNGSEVKVEPNFILRGVVGVTRDIELCSKAKELSHLGTTVQCVSQEDLYGGKICAALDRQHSRDLFDIKILMESSGITKEIKDAFIFYLVSSNRPMIELLSPNLISIDSSYNNEFLGMHEGDIKKIELEDVRIRLISKINSMLTSDDKKFLLGVASGKPDWALAPIKNMYDYPSVKWKIYNIGKMNIEKREDNFKKLRYQLI